MVYSNFQIHVFEVKTKKAIDFESRKFTSPVFRKKKTSQIQIMNYTTYKKLKPVQLFATLPKYFAILR